MMKQGFRLLTLLLLSAGMALSSHVAADSQLPPMADIHIHFNWNQEEIISADEVVAILRQHNVVLTVVSSVPSRMAEKLRTAGGDWVLPFFSPYYDARNRYGWFGDPRVVEETRKALESGHYFGIGEVHVVSPIGPRRDNPVFKGLLQLAEEFDVPFMIHTEASSYKFFLPICQAHPKVRFMWAHAGGNLGPTDVEALMQACPNVWVEFSARDPWHYGTFVGDDGKLLPGWTELLARYPGRFMTGTDPVWNAQQMYRWYEADEGWSHYGQLNQFHRNWMNQLPPQLEMRIRLSNAQVFFGQR